MTTRFAGLVLGLSLCVASAAAALPEIQPGPFELGPDSFSQEGVPQGEVKGPFEFHSKIFEGTVRQYWIFVPEQYNAEKPASLLVFQDGYKARHPTGAIRAPQVMANLIAKGDIPVMIGIFISPGNMSEKYPAEKIGWGNPDNRAEEYDALNDNYARFLIEEMIPLVEKSYNITDDPEERVIGGTSSGAICAFTVAWERPDAFRKVISSIGSYTSIGYRPAKDGNPIILGGDMYPTLVRRTPIKPIKIFIQDGTNDIDNYMGNWFLSNQRMVKAFGYANRLADRRKIEGPRYQTKHVWTDGKHNDDHVGVYLPEMLRWLWSDETE